LSDRFERYPNNVHITAGEVTKLEALKKFYLR